MVKLNFFYVGAIEVYEVNFHQNMAVVMVWGHLNIVVHVMGYPYNTDVIAGVWGFGDVIVFVA